MRQLTVLSELYIGDYWIDFPEACKYFRIAPQIFSIEFEENLSKHWTAASEI